MMIKGIEEVDKEKRKVKEDEMILIRIENDEEMKKMEEEISGIENGQVYEKSKKN